MDPVKITQDLIALKSYDGADGPFFYIKELLETSGIEMSIIESNGVKNIHATIGEGEAEIGFNGHYDTVPPGTGWETDPLEPVIKGGELYGLGATDMKGGLAAMLVAYLELAEEDLSRKVILQVVGDEEKGGEHGTRTLIERGLYAKRMVIGEPSGEGIAYAHKGLVRADVKTFGKRAHGSRLYAGDSAVLRAIRIINKIAEDKILILKATRDESVNLKTCNIGLFRGGETINVIPEECYFGLDIRVPVNEDMENVVKYLESLMDEKSKVEISMKIKGMYTAPDHELVVNAKEVAERVLERKLELRIKLGGCDGHFFTEKNIPTISMGPTGYDENGNKVIHRSNEHVGMKSIKEWKDAYKALALHYCKSR
ncbi:ArgE/DapE family deacylase [Candidatus Micrarchaeota archaeon]|nr:ArgE/DapE family deacylase [Candidatus Micrarchaeota archaeon]